MHKEDKRIVDNRVEPKRKLRQDFYAVAVNPKGKSFIVTFENVNNVVARKLATKWARNERLTLETVQAYK